MSQRFLHRLGLSRKRNRSGTHYTLSIVDEKSKMKDERGSQKVERKMPRRRPFVVVYDTLDPLWYTNCYTSSVRVTVQFTTGM